MVIALVALLATDDAWRDRCRVLVDKGAIDDAADCYGDAAADAANDDDAAFAIALADVVSHARLKAPVVERAVRRDAVDNGFDLGDFAYDGRAEVTGLGFVNGGIVGTAIAGLATSVGYTDLTLTLLPVAGAVVGGGGAAGAMLLLGDDKLSAGDVHVLRFGLLLAPYESLTVGTLLGAANAGTGVVAASVVVVSAATVAASVGVAAGFDVDPAAPSLATSFGWIGGTTAALLWAASDLPPSSSTFQQGIAIGALGAHAGIVGGFAAAPALHLTRPATLLVDAGGAAGFLVGSALAFGLNAPNPQLGYGSIAVAGLVGAGAGVVGAIVVSADDDDEGAGVSAGAAAVTE